MNDTLQRREAFIAENLGLVHSCAHRFTGKGIEYDDLYSAGCMGLVKAVDGFDTGRGVKFSTYAVPVILGEIRRLFRDGGTVKVSRSLKERSMKVNRQREHFVQVNGREPTVSELAQCLELQPEEVAQAIGVSTPPLSLTESDDQGGGQLDIPTDSIEDRLLSNLSLMEELKKLEPKDQKLIILRYFRSKTQTETAQELGMTQVQVSRREKKILTALRGRLQ